MRRSARFSPEVSIPAHAGRFRGVWALVATLCPMSQPTITEVTARAGAKHAVRFGVRDDIGRTSGVWRLWSHRGDVYLAARTLGGVIKVSLHATGNWKTAFSSEYMRRTDRLPVEKPGGITDRWEPPKLRPRRAEQAPVPIRPEAHWCCRRSPGLSSRLRRCRPVERPRRLCHQRPHTRRPPTRPHTRRAWGATVPSYAICLA